MNLLGPIYLINFEDSIRELQEILMYVAYFILLTGLIVRVVRASDSNMEMVALIKPIFISFFIVAIISTISFWFDRLDNGFNGLAEHINENFGSEPFAVTQALMDTVAEDPEAEGWGVEKIVQSVYLSVVYGLAKIAVITAALLQVPFFILQYVLKWLGFLFLPIGLSLLIFPSLSNIGVKLISNLLAVFAWPIGFAITNLAAMGFINDFATSATFTGNSTGATLYMMSFGSLVMGLIAALILVIGTIATPTIMFILFSSGAGLQGITGAVTGAALFATYMSSGAIGGGKKNSGGSDSSQSSPKGGGGSGPGSTSGSEGIGPSGGPQFHEPASPYSSTSTDLGPLRNYGATSSHSGPKSLPNASGKALPSSPHPNNPLLPNKPNDPSGDRHAARIYALGSTSQPVINI